MTVSTLIERLKLLPQNSIVMVSGYEGGYDEAVSVFQRKMQKMKRDEPYFGDFDIADSNNPEMIIDTITIA
jgi:hypothetical protein